MLPEGSIHVDRLWKRFRADRTRNLLRDRISDLPGRIRSQWRPKWNWVLRDVSCEIGPGESVALFGSNGSGKSTLLKILTQVMYPYAGSIELAGRVGALIEVKSGLHGDLTGRENISLYGALLGLKPREISSRFDDIVEFADLADAVDRQIKFYSSGMQMRLGFSVAAFLEPAILLVDEALAVGDAYFQQRCLDRMRRLILEGTTLVLVSHDLAAMEAVCGRGLWLNEGVLEHDGPIREALGAYRSWVEGHHAEVGSSGTTSVLPFADLRVSGSAGAPVRSHGSMTIDFALDSPVRVPTTILFGITEGTANPIFLVQRELDVPEGRMFGSCTIPNLPLPSGRFYLWAAILDPGGRDLLAWHPARQVDVVGAQLHQAPKGIMRLAPVDVEASWSNSGGTFVADSAAPPRSVDVP